MFADTLQLLAQSATFMWGAIMALLTVAVFVCLFRKRKAIPSSSQKSVIDWHKRFSRLVIPVILVLLIGGGLAMLIRVNTESAEPLREDIRSIDAVYLLDISGSMFNDYQEQQGDCIDRNEVVRIKNGKARADCAAITALDRLLDTNDHSNVAVILFGGTSIIVGPSMDHESIMNTVWLNWAKAEIQSLVGATDIRQALKKAMTLLDVGNGQHGRTPIIIASDFRDWNQDALIALISKLANEGFNIVVIAINYETSTFEHIKDILGEGRVWAIDRHEDIERISLDFNSQSNMPGVYASSTLQLERGFSWSVLLGTGMLIAALIVSIVFVRTIRWPITD